MRSFSATATMLRCNTASRDAVIPAVKAFMISDIDLHEFRNGLEVFNLIVILDVFVVTS